MWSNSLASGSEKGYNAPKRRRIKILYAVSVNGSSAGKAEKRMELIQTLDGEILLWIQQVVRQEFLNPLVCLYTKLGDDGLLWIVLSLGLMLYKPTRKAGVAALLAMLLGLVLNNMIIKELVGRPRPWLDVEGLEYVIYEASKNSFPSGHTCSSFAAASAWHWLVPKKWIRVSGWVMAVCMGLSRLYIGVHYPTDVIAGAAVGVFCGWVACRICAGVSGKLGGKIS